MWTDKNPETQLLFDVFKKEGHEVAYWIGLNGGEYMAPKGTIFHDHYDAWNALPAPALVNLRFSPPDARILSSMYKTESIILSMMNKRYDSKSVDERKQIYYDMLGYWNHVFDKIEPEAVIFFTIPHSIYSNIIYEIARMRGIKTLCSDPTWVANRLIWYEDFWNGSDELRSAITRNQNKSVSPHDLGSELQKYWEEHTGEKYGKEPAYMTVQRNIGEGVGLIKHRLRVALRAMREGNFFQLVFDFLLRFGKDNLKREHERVEKKADWDIPFVYFPLHFQPECTSTPQGGAYHQQILVAETLSAALPRGWQLFIKEHPAQWWMRGKTRFSSARYRGYYERLASIPRVRLVPISTDTFQLTKRSQAVAVIAGTSGWEALLYGKYPLVFGIPWYRDCPGVLRVDSVESCVSAFKKVMNGAHVPQNSLLAFLKSVEEISIRAYIENPPGGDPTYSAQENMRIIASHLSKLLLAD